MSDADGSGTFLAAAQQGMFGVDTAASKQMITSIEQMQTKLTPQEAYCDIFFAVGNAASVGFSGLYPRDTRRACAAADRAAAFVEPKLP